jgi:hypothetical protein
VAPPELSADTEAALELTFWVKDGTCAELGSYLDKFRVLSHRSPGRELQPPKSQKALRMRYRPKLPQMSSTSLFGIRSRTATGVRNCQPI